MNRTRTDHLSHQELTAALRRLDPADNGHRSAPDTELLERILTTGSSDSESIRSAGNDARVPRRFLTRPLLGAVAASTTALGVVVAPAFLADPPAASAWTAVPSQAGPDAMAAAGAACRDHLLQLHQAPVAIDDMVRGETQDDTGEVVTRPLTEQEYAEHRDLEQRSAQAVAASEPVIADVRGDWIMVVLTGPDGYVGDCLTNEPVESAFQTQAVGSSGFPTFADGAAPGPRDILAGSWGPVALDTGFVGRPEHANVITAAVGDEVKSVVVHTQDEGDVTASIGGGQLAVWWPGREQDDAFTIPVTITFTDGTSEQAVLGLYSPGAP